MGLCQQLRDAASAGGDRVASWPGAGAGQGGRSPDRRPQGRLPAAFESEDYQKRRSAIEQEIRSQNERAFTALRDKATAKGIAILRTPMGFAMAPMKDGEVVPPAEFNAWPAERQHEVQAAIEELEKDLEETLRVLPRLEREQRDAVRALDRETARFAIAQPIEECKAQFADLPKVGGSTWRRSRPISWRTSHCSSLRRRRVRRRQAGAAWRAVRPLQGQRIRHASRWRARCAGGRGSASDARAIWSAASSISRCRARW